MSVLIYMLSHDQNIKRIFGPWSSSTSKSTVKTTNKQYAIGFRDFKYLDIILPQKN